MEGRRQQLPDFERREEDEDAANPHGKPYSWPQRLEDHDAFRRATFASTRRSSWEEDFSVKTFSGLSLFAIMGGRYHTKCGFLCLFNGLVTPAAKV